MPINDRLVSGADLLLSAGKRFPQNYTRNQIETFLEIQVQARHFNHIFVLNKVVLLNSVVYTSCRLRFTLNLKRITPATNCTSSDNMHILLPSLDSVNTRRVVREITLSPVNYRFFWAMGRLLGVIFLLLLTSCENMLEVTLESPVPKLVVLSTFTENTPWQVKIQHTVGLQESSTQSTAVKDATVTITGNDGSFVELVHRGGGLYYSNTSLPKAGVHYTLRAQADGYQSVEASDQLPNSIQVGEVQLLTYQDHIQIDLHDEADIRNYYQVMVMEAELDLTPKRFIVLNGELKSQMTRFASQDPLVPDLSRPEVLMALIHDKPFNGKEFSLSLSADLKIFPRIEPSVYISSTSKAYYEYYLSKFVQNNNKNLPFSEPDRVISNIINGYGIFAGYSLYVHGSKITPETVKQILPTSYRQFIFGSNDPEDYNYIRKIEFSLHEDMSVTGFMELPRPSQNADRPIVSIDGVYTIAHNVLPHGYVVELHHDAVTFFNDEKLVIGNYSGTNSDLTDLALSLEQEASDIDGEYRSISRGFWPRGIGWLEIPQIDFVMGRLQY